MIGSKCLTFDLVNSILSYAAPYLIGSLLTIALCLSLIHTDTLHGYLQELTRTKSKAIYKQALGDFININC